MDGRVLRDIVSHRARHIDDGQMRFKGLPIEMADDGQDNPLRASGLQVGKHKKGAQPTRSQVFLYQFNLLVRSRLFQDDKQAKGQVAM